MTRFIVLALMSGGFFLLPSPAALAQRPAEEAAPFAAYLATGTQVNANITYLTASGVELSSTCIARAARQDRCRRRCCSTAVAIGFNPPRRPSR